MAMLSSINPRITYMKAIESTLLLALFLGFIILLITAVVTHSTPLMLLAFVVGFLGYAMCEHIS